MSAGCYDSGFGDPATPTPPAATTTLRTLQEMSIGAPVRVDTDVVVEGCVTSSDEAGNFYRSLTIEDDGAAMELLAGEQYLYTSYPVGCRVSLRLRGLTLARSRGVLQAGMAADAASRYDVDYIPSRAALDKHLVRHGIPFETIEPLRTTIAGLTPEMCGCLVRIDNVAYTPEADSIIVRGWAGERRFTDTEGHEIHTFVREYARFAYTSWPVEKLSGSITGILQLDGKEYTLRPRDEKDLDF